MSKIGNYRIELQETEDYQWGWESAERGEPAPDWGSQKDARYQCQVMGWRDYHDRERSQ